MSATSMGWMSPPSAGVWNEAGLQLDRTRIAIRERRPGEILDLALRVTRDNPAGLACALSLGAVPLFAWNAWLLSRLAAPPDEFDLLVRYLWALLQLTFLEAPLAAIWLTPYLGGTLFLEPTDWRSFLRRMAPVIPRVLIRQGLGRGIFAGWLLASGIDAGPNVSPAEVWLTFLSVLVLILRLRRPYLNEIILLERNPLRSSRPEVLSIGQRARALHRAGREAGAGGGLIQIPVAIALFASLVGTAHFLLGSLGMQWERGGAFFQLLVPTLGWLVVGFLAIVRFLSYLDLRIRREGWEVELLVRAASGELAP